MIYGLEEVFFLPLSNQAYDELQQLQTYLADISYDDSSVDIWEPIWGTNYSSCHFYAHVFSQVDAHPCFKLLWRSQCTPRIKFFAWLILVDRLNTKTMLRRRHLNIEDDALCVLCNMGIEEDMDHLFFDCPFARQCWNYINFSWDTDLPL